MGPQADVNPILSKLAANEMAFLCGEKAASSALCEEEEDQGIEVHRSLLKEATAKPNLSKKRKSATKPNQHLQPKHAKPSPAAGEAWAKAEADADADVDDGDDRASLFGDFQEPEEPLSEGPVALGGAGEGCGEASTASVGGDVPCAASSGSHSAPAAAVAHPIAALDLDIDCYVPPGGATLRRVDPMGASSHWCARLPKGDRFNGSMSCTAVFGQKRSERQAKLICIQYLQNWWADKMKKLEGGGA